MFDKETRLVPLSPNLLKLYKISVPADAPADAPVFFTFSDPDDALVFLCQAEVVAEEDVIQPFREKSSEEQWGEMELRLAFFSDIHKWQ